MSAMQTGSPDTLLPPQSREDSHGTRSQTEIESELADANEATTSSPKRARLSPTPVDDIESKVHMCFAVRYAKTTAEVRLADDETVADLKAMLFSLTDVPLERQKILGLVRGKLPGDETVLGELQFPPASLRDSPHPTTGEKRITITLVGTPIDQTFKDPEAHTDMKDAASSAIKKLHGDISYSDPKIIEQIRNFPLTKDRNAIKKLKKVVERHSKTFHIMHPPRENLKGGLLVLDLDYTIADTKRLLHYRVHAREAERPGLHEFLRAVYPYYDICVWSQTSLFWLEAKLTELGCLTNPHYNISFVLDQTPMFTVYPEFKRDTPLFQAALYHPETIALYRSGKLSASGLPFSRHKVKALEVIWRRFPNQYGAANTIHIDDLARNFALNPQNGLKIRAFRTPQRGEERANNTGQPLASPQDDRELFDLQKYLLQLAHPSVKDLRSKDGHARWKECPGPSVLDADSQLPAPATASSETRIETLSSEQVNDVVDPSQPSPEQAPPQP